MRAATTTRRPSSLASGPGGTTTSRGRFESTKPTELRFRALLTEGDTRVHFHRKGFDRLKEDLV